LLEFLGLHAETWLVATTLERGTAFELQICALFESRGYRATHNVRMTGRSGAEHQIDVLAEFELPLQAVRIVVEAKAHDHAIDKDILLKLSQIVDDLGADRGVLVTTSHFTPGALKMAEGRNIDLWDREHISLLLGEAALAAAEDGAVEGGDTTLAGALKLVSMISFDEARQQVERGVEKRRKGGVFGVGSLDEELVAFEEIAFPFYEVVLEVPTLGEERRGLLKKETVKKVVPVRISVGAEAGWIVTVSDTGKLQRSSYSLPVLSQEEAELIDALSTDWFGRDDLTALGYPQAKAQRLVASLRAKGALSASKQADRRVAYRITAFIPLPDPDLKPITSGYATEEAAHGSGFRPASRSQSGVIRALETLVRGGRVVLVTTIYHPYYRYVLKRPDGSHRAELLNALTGEITQIVNGD
jgi:hypothetical protein